METELKNNKTIDLWVLPPSLLTRMVNGDCDEVQASLVDCVPWPFVEDNAEKIESPGYATPVNQESGEPITLFRIPIIISRAMPDNVAFCLISVTRSFMTSLLVKMVTGTWLGKVTATRHTLQLIGLITEEDIPRIIFNFSPWNKTAGNSGQTS
jgi:hypothetical protein